MGVAGGVNVYRFNNGNPVSFGDPFGLCPFCLPLGVAGAAIGGIGQVASNFLNDRPLGQGVGRAVGVGAAAGLTLGLAAPAIAASVGVGVVGSGAATAAGGAGATENANKLIHIFGKTSHNLGPLVEKFGSQEATFSAVQRAAQAAVTSSGIKGFFETTVNVAGQSVVVKGKVIEGVARVGTFYIQ